MTRRTVVTLHLPVAMMALAGEHLHRLGQLPGKQTREGYE